MTATRTYDISTTLADVSQAALHEIVEDAYLPALLVTLSHLTGDRSLLAEQFRSSTVAVSLGLDPSGGLSPDTTRAARAQALTALLTFRDGGALPVADPDDDDLLTLMQFTTGPVSEEYVPLLVHELGLSRDSGAPGWTKADLAPDREFRVAVIGGGMSGLAAAHRLGQAGVPYVLFERSEDIGGVWFANNYPGARLDTSNLTYTYSFHQSEWDDVYSQRDAVLDYFHEVARDRDIMRNVRLNTTVQGGSFDEAAGTWTLMVDTADGRCESMIFNAIISAVGQLSEPNYPDIPGRDTFAGESWHTARWRHDVDLAGQRVALIGTGASAFQVVPSTAASAAQLTVFQRTPAWLLPTPTYTARITDGQRWLMHNLPHYQRWYRFNQFWLNMEGIRHLALVDPEWKHPVSVSAQNEMMRAGLERYLRQTFAERPDLIEKLLPSYPPYAKRTVRDDGTWSTAMMRSNVTLTTEAIEAITEDGVLTHDGVVHVVDVIIYGTGFSASDFLSSLALRGRDGTLLQDQWNGDARAYYGISIPNFPNLFCLYGPNTNLNVNGSTVLFSEAAAEHALECIRTLLASGSKAIEIAQPAFQSFNDKIDRACLTLAMGVSTVNAWYKNRFGRVSQNWPLSTLEYWQGTRGPQPGSYTYL